MTKRNKELRKIYLRAAEDIATKWDYCCNAIRRASKQLQIKDEGNLATKLFRFLYQPYPFAKFFWLQDEFDPDACQQNRILALLFMAELARTDSLPTLTKIQTACTLPSLPPTWTSPSSNSTTSTNFSPMRKPIRTSHLT